VLQISSPETLLCQPSAGHAPKAAPTGADGPPAIVPAPPLAPTEASRRWAEALRRPCFSRSSRSTRSRVPAATAPCGSSPASPRRRWSTRSSPTSGPAPPLRRTPGRGAPHRRGPPRAGGRHAPHARPPTLRRSPEFGPDAPPPRGDLWRGRLSHRRDGLAPAGIAPPTVPAVPTALEAHERVGGHAATRQSVLVRAVIASYTQPTQIEIPIPSPPSRPGVCTSVPAPNRGS
jgi:hypothetical protein